MKKLIKWILTFFIVVVVLVIGAGAIITYFYKDEVVGLVVDEINKNLQTQVDVKEISFTVFKHFPDASLIFSHVLVHSPKDFSSRGFHGINTDTLLFSENLSLDFNLIDIIKKKYNFHRIGIENGRFNLFIDKQGKNNLNIFKQDTSTANINIDLQKILLSKVRVQIRDTYKKLTLLTKVNRMAVSGNFSDETFNFNTEGQLFISDFTNDGINYVKEKHASLNVGFNYDGKAYHIEDGKIALEDLNFALSGNFNITPETNLDLAVQADNISIEKLLSLLPKKYITAVEDYSGKGNLQFDAKITGLVNYRQSPHIEASYSIQDGELIYRPNDFALNQIQFSGSFTNGKNNDAATTILKLKTVSAKMENTNFSGKFVMENFHSPQFNTNIDIHSDLSDIKQFFDLDTLIELAGTIDGKIRTQGNFRDINNISRQEWAKVSNQGFFRIKNGIIQFKNQEKAIQTINGKVLFKNDLAQMDSLAMNFFGHPLLMSGNFYHFLAYFFEDNVPFSSNITVRTSSLNLKDLMVENFRENNAEDTVTTVKKDFFSSVSLFVDTLNYGKFYAYNLKAKGVIKTQQINVNSFSCESLDGAINGTAYFNTGKEKKMEVAALLKTVNVRKLFQEFDNFNQDFIIDKNLKGKLTANINFSCNLTDEYAIIEKSILSNSKIHIANGELISFEPMQKLSKFVDVYELSHINFSDLDNEIFIQNKKIIIPQMHIKSSAMDLDIAGEHGFNNVFSYHLKLLMSQLLSKKAKKAKPENSEFGIIEDDGSNRTSLYLIIAGTPDNYRVSYDSESVKKHINERLKEEKENLKQIIKEEFHWFSKDTTKAKNKKHKNNKSNSDDSGFQFEFE